jgi:tetratricopeptide (TPR) repeat protein
MLSYADSLANRGRLADSLPIYQRVVEQVPNSGQAWTSIGQVQRRLGRFRDAEEALRRGMATHPEPWMPAVELALMYLKDDELNRPQDAIPVLRLAIDDVERPGRASGLTPGGGGRPYLLMAIALDLSGNPQAGRPMLEKASKYAPVRDEALRLLREWDAPAGSP